VSVSPSAKAARTGPEQNRRHGERPHHLAPVAAGALALVAMALVAVVAGTGWLYLLRQGHVFGFGPSVPGSLELEQLASADAQPLARLAVAWVPAGLVLGLALGSLRPRSPASRALIGGVAVFCLLILLGAVSDSVENAQSVAERLGDQLGRAGPWVATALVVTGTYLGARARGARPERGARASSAG
jgi:hypothetical protein